MRRSYLINDACYLAGKPLVDGSILIFDGQATVFTCLARAATGVCFPLRLHREWCRTVPRPGCLGALTGLVGSIQAVETLKLLLGIGESLCIAACWS